MSPSLPKSSFVFVILFTISCIVPFTTALPGGLRPRETLPDFLSFIPSCAVKCTSRKIADVDCRDNSQACLCNSPGFQDSLWECIDGDCGGPRSQAHDESESTVKSLCKSRDSMTETSSSSTSSQTPTSATADGPLATTTTEDTASASTAVIKKERPKLSTPAIVGISIGAFCLTAAVIGACVFCICRKNHRKQAQSLEPHAPRGGAAISGDKENIGYGGWISIDHSNNTGGYYSNHGVTPINTDVANEKPNIAHNGLNISPASPVSPTIFRGFEFGESIEQRRQPVGSQKIMENPHQFMPPAMIYTPPSPIGSVDRTSDSVILPSPAQNRIHSSNFSVHSYDGYPGIAISTDSQEDFQMSSQQHTCSSNTEKRSYHPSDPLISAATPSKYTPSPPVSEGAASIRSSINSTQGPPTTGISRSDTLAWRRELDEAAGRALTRVLHSEQSINEEMDEAKRRKSSIPGLNRFSRRLSRDHRADEENSLVGGEKSTGFWGGFGSKSSRTSRTSPSKNSGFMNRRSNSNASGGSKRSIIPGALIN
ncbi:hypothetical protein DFP73DRAFT_482400 [Morchella snyderi]|nr:hypothetical protein DFP73DRAFT_482400 [Morchella snyderi]